MEQLWVRDCDHVSRHTSACFTTRVPNEVVLTAAATLDGAERGLLAEAAVDGEDLTEMVVVMDRINAAKLVRSALGQEVLVIPLPDKEDDR